jgi:hypothetical protein
MARITCRTPSTGKALSIVLKDVPTDFIKIAEAPDFSVPDTANLYPNRDPLNPSRAIRAGEVFFLTPLAVKNKTAGTAWIETILRTESNTTIEFGRVEVPAQDTVFVSLQGRSLLKRDPISANGDSVLIRAGTSEAFDIWIAADEKTSSEHLGVE